MLKAKHYKSKFVLISMKIQRTIHDGIFQIRERRALFTQNLTPKKTFFCEKTIVENNLEYRYFDSRRSKLAAAVLKGISRLPLRKGQSVLYLGASHGYTSSFVSDIVGKNGFVFCLDFAPRVVRDLVFVCEQRENMTPLLEDAFHPERYAKNISKVDLIYQDIAQKNQVQILVKNAEMFLKPKGYALLALKSRSVDVTKNPRDIFTSVEFELKKKFRIIDKKRLEPYERDHAFYVLQLI